MSGDIEEAVYEFIHESHSNNHTITILFSMTKYNVFLYLSFFMLGILLHLIIKFTRIFCARLIMIF